MDNESEAVIEIQSPHESDNDDENDGHDDDDDDETILRGEV